MADFSPLYESAGRQYNVDPALLRAVAQVESSSNAGTPDSSAGARGLMQLMPETAKRLGVTDPRDPAQAIPAAARLLDEGLTRYNGDLTKALHDYHAGPDQAGWGPLTRAYPGKVFAAYQGGTAPKAPAANTEADDVFNAAFGGKGAAKNPEVDDVFNAAFGPKKAGPAAPVAGATPGAPDTRPTASSTPPPGAEDQPMVGPRAAPIGRMVEEFKASPLGPSDAFLDSIGLRADGASGLLRAPVRGLLAAGDAGMRVGNALMKTGADTAGDIAQTAAGVTNAVGLTNVDPTTAGNQLQRDAYQMIANAGLTHSGIPTARGPAPNPIVTAGRAEGAAAPAMLAAPTEAAVAAPAAAEAAAPARLGMMPDGRLEPVPTAEGAPAAAAAPPEAMPGAAPANALTAPAAATAEAAASANPITSPAPESPLAVFSQPRVEAAAPEMSIPKELPARKTPVVTAAQADREADRIIRHFAGDGPNALIDGGVNGEHRTLALATGNAGIAALERSAMDVNPNAFTAKAAARGEARANHLQGAVGTPADIEALEATRDASTARAREAAFKDAQPVNPSPVVKAIDEALASPEGQRDAVRTSLQNIRAKLIQTDPATGGQTLQTDPAQLYGIRKAISDAISPKAAGTASDARLAASELIAVQKELDKVIESGAPGYKGYMKSYSEQSKPIEAMQYLQSLNLTDPKGNITLGKVDAALKAIEKQRNLPGPRDAKSITEVQYNALQQLRDDLRIEAHSELGKGIGSNTFQKLATNAKVDYLSRGNLLVGSSLGLEGMVHSPGVAVTMGAAKLGLDKATARGNDLVYQALMRKLLNPEVGVQALQRNQLTGPRVPPAP